MKNPSDLDAFPTMPDGKARHGYDWLKPVPLGLCLLATAGCAMGPPKPSPAEVRERMERFSMNGGYAPAHRFAIASVRETWPHRQSKLDVSFLVPEGSGSYPLVVYLPGLGEDAMAAPLWREAWASAGYAVFTVQPVREADALKGLGPLRPDDRHAIGRGHFSTRSLETRLDAVAFALDGLRQRTNNPGSPYAKADLNRLAVAGYDLGAQTAAALAGEMVKAPMPDWHGLGFRAAILLSPFADLAAGALISRYKTMDLPMLAITGSEDDDPYGITSASLRTVPWHNAPPGGKYLLSFEGGGHGVLAGAALEKDGGEPQAGEMPDDMPMGGPPPGGMGRPSGAPGKRPSDFRHLAAVRVVSTAFLDMAVKDDAGARQWLSREAGRWLGQSAKLQAR